VQTGGSAERTFDGLVRVDHARFDRVWVRPGGSLVGYESVQLTYAGFAYRREPRGNNRTATDNYALDAKQQLLLRETLAEVFVEELERDGGWRVVQEAGPKSLSIRGGLIDVVVHAPPERGSNRDRVWVASAGEATLVLEIHDSETGQILVRIADRDAAESAGGGMRSMPINNRFETRRMFRGWAKRLRSGLDAAQALSPFQGG
jgi:hypothetical protein